MIVIVYNSSKGRFENIFSSEPQDVIIIDLDLESHEPIHVNDDFSECLVDTPYDLLKQYYRLMTGEQPSIYRLAQWHKQLGNKIDYAVEKIDNDDYPSSPIAIVGDWGIFSKYPSNPKECLQDFYAYEADARAVFLEDFVGETDWAGNKFYLDLDENSYYILRQVTNKDICA